MGASSSHPVIDPGALRHNPGVDLALLAEVRRMNEELALLGIDVTSNFSLELPLDGRMLRPLSGFGIPRRSAAPGSAR
jgi:hypothetical protein